MVSYTIRSRKGVKGNTFMLDMTLPDGSRYRPSFKTKQAAEFEAKRKLEEIKKLQAAQVLGLNFVGSPGVRPLMKVSDAIRKHIEIKEAEIVDPDNIRAYKYIYKYIYEALFDLEVDYVHQITREKVQSLRAHWKKNGLSNNTANKRVRALKTLLRECIGWDLIDKNPCDGFKPLSEDTQSREPWSKQDYEEIHFRLPPWCQRIVTFMFMSGCRPKEAIQMKDQDISFLNKTVVLRSGKGGGSIRRLSLTDNQMAFMEEVLAQRRKEFPFGQYVFVDDKGGKIYRNRISDHVAAARKAAGIKRQLVPYGTRHGFITELQELNVAFGKVQALAGHRRADTTRRYTHMADESLRQAMRILEKKRKRQG